MRVNEAKECFRELTKQYFGESATVIFSSQPRAVKPGLRLVSLTAGPIHRPQAPVYTVENGHRIGHYLTRMSMQVDLFTHGSPITDDTTGNVLAYENSALDELITFADYLNSDASVDWCRQKDITVLIDTDAQDVTGVVNDTSYEYRARLPVWIYFTIKTFGKNAEEYKPAKTESDTAEVITKIELEEET